jgi:hypothetical protein
LLQEAPAGVLDLRHRRSLDLCLDDRRDLGVGGAGIVGVSDLQVAVGGGQRIEHAAPRFLGLEMKVVEQVQRRNRAFVHLAGVLHRRAHVPDQDPADDDHHHPGEREQRPHLMPVEDAGAQPADGRACRHGRGATAPSS